MKKTVNINLSGRVFYIDDDAFARLRAYLDRLGRYFKKQEGGQEIINDIESRIAELLGERIADKSGVISIELVEEVIGMMGQPEDFEEEGEEKTSSKRTAYHEVYQRSSKRLYRDIDNRVLGGVCSGIGAYLNVDPVFVRIIFAILTLVGLGIVIPVYIILWIVVPAAITTAQKLEMRGENVTISNIEKAIRNEYEDVKEQFSKVRQSSAYKKGESWWNKFTKRDKTLLTILVVVVSVFFFANLIPLNNIQPDFFHHMNFQMVHMPFFHFPGIAVLVLMMLLVGLIFRSLFKIIIYLIAFMFLAIVGIKVIGFLFGSVLMLC